MKSINIVQQTSISSPSKKRKDKLTTRVLQQRLRKSVISALSVTVLCFGFINAGAGATLSAWDVEGVDLDSDSDTGIDSSPADEDYTFTAGTMADNVNNAKLTLSSEVNRSTTSGQYGFKISSDDETDSLEAAITAEHYMQFTTHTDDGYVMNLDALEMKGESSGTGADNVAILADMDGNGWDTGDDIASVSNIAGDDGGFDTDSKDPLGGPVDLTDSQYQGIANVSFRIYGWNTSSGDGITYLRDLSDNDLNDNDLVVTGELTAVPEPGTLVLLIFGAISLLWPRRGRKV